ncbi:nuclease harbi1 [Lasius niger]|uniref:Nuclease harbi1 n=1 Tax=Lasius niger TaxID=67767 RepID=A0A0J7KJ54_LASNI|nr:nuclease harbi1 [Lasius niger]
MTTDTYTQLEQRFGLVLQGNVNVKSHIPVKKQLLASLWLLATPDSYRSVGKRFEISKSSLSVSFIKVVEALNDIAGRIIKWLRGCRLEEVKIRLLLTDAELELSITVVDQQRLDNAMFLDLTEDSMIVDGYRDVMKYGRYTDVTVHCLKLDSGCDPFVIIACTVLHNICLEGLGEDIGGYILEDQENEVYADTNLVREVHKEDAGVAKRKYLVTLLR